MKRRPDVLVMDRIGGSDRVKLAQATRHYLEREMALLTKIALLERKVHALELDLSLAVRTKRVEMSESCYRDPRTPDAEPLLVGRRGKRTAPVHPA